MIRKILLIILLLCTKNYCQVPAVPSGLQSYSYEKHIELEWNPNTETSLTGYKIYKWNGSGYTLKGSISKEKNDFIEFLSQTCIINYYKINK